MTKEELKLEALKYLENFKDCANCKHRWGDCADELDEDCLINNCYSATPKEQDIYLAGAEPREKRIEELIALINAERERQEKCDDVHLRTIAELEKENAELKKQLEMSNKVYNDNLDYSHHIEEQLTEAKEIIKIMKHLLFDVWGYIDFPFEERVNKFLSEVEK